MKLFQWPGRTNKRAFRDRVSAALRERFPEATIVPTEDLAIVLTGAGDFDKLELWLGRAYAEFCENPAAADELVERWVRHVASSTTDTTNANDIVPVIKGSNWLDEQRESARQLGGKTFNPWVEAYNEHVVVVYAEFRDGLHFTDSGALQQLGPLPELRERAIANLRRRIQGPTVTGNDGSYLLGAGGTLDSSLLLLDDIVDSSGLELRGRPLIGVSDRDGFWVADSENPWAVFRTAAGVARCFKTQDYAISPHLFCKSGSKYEPLDGLLIDESHAIPNLGVIDVHALKRGGGSELGVVVASPLGADARSVYRLFRKLDGHLEEINSKAYADECGPPTPQRTTIHVKLHPGSDPVIRDVLDAAVEWVAARNAALRVTA